MVQIRDVSKRAGVSPATVSRAFSDPSKLTEETLKRVLKAADDLDYKPSSLAKIFRGKRTNSVLVMVPDIANVLFARVLSGIERVAADNNYFLLVSDTGDNTAVEKAGIDMVDMHRADGVIQLGERPLRYLHRAGDDCKVPFVHAVEIGELGDYPTVKIDNVAAAEAMATYLAALGHKHIGVLAGLKDRKVTQQRLIGFRRALTAFGIAHDDALVEYGPYSLQGGAQSAMRLLSRQPQVTALFCMSDEIAIGAIRTALDRGMKLPDELSVTGFDNIEFGKYCDPPLTTVMQPAERIGEIAMTLMCNLLRNEPVGEYHQRLPTELTIRASAKRLM
ncbi:MAG: LacI family DNA-binding transcriptional regulator [Hyphomonas sp.]